MPHEAHFEVKLEKVGIHDLEFLKKSKGFIKSTGDMKFASLHHHSTFSYLDGFGTPEQHVRRAADLGMPAMALTEHGNMSSHPRFERSAKAAGIKPIFGCEMYCGPIDLHRKQIKNHLTLLAETKRGYRNLLRMVERSYSEGFYYEPTISGDILAEHKNDIVVLSGCLGSLLSTSIVGGKNIPEHKASIKRGTDVARRFKTTFGDSYYLEVQAFPELERTRHVNQAIEKISRKLHIPIIASNDVHYCLPENREMQQILHNIRGGGRQTLEEQAADWGYDVDLCHPEGHRLLYKRLRATGLSKLAAQEAISNTLEVMERCNVELPKAEKLRYPSKKDSMQIWRAWLKRGWNFRGCNNLPKRERNKYIKRLRHEMKVIEDKDFIDYFLVVSEAVRWAKRKEIPIGPARGSAAGSLVCWLLRITEVNPMLFSNLVFERFIDVTREDEPDIDLDFDDELRDDVRLHLVDKYGQDNVANLGTFSFYKAKNSLDDIARVHHIPQWEVNKVKEKVIERSTADLRANATIEDTAEMFEDVREVFEEFPDLRYAMDLEGNIKNMGVHAAGLVVSNTPIRMIAPIHQRNLGGRDISVVALDKYDAEVMGMLKMDFLRLKTMGLIRIALEQIGMKLTELYDLPFDDEETMQGFQDNDVVGVFQFDGQATKDINGAIKPDDFDEVCHVNALARPGPLHNGATAAYIDVKRGNREPRKLHPLYDEITKDTKFEIVYQEQILRIVTEIGGFDWTHVSYIRRLISRKMGEQEFMRQRDKFMAGAKKNGFKENVANEIWLDCITAGAYAFNAAHAVSYGMLAYWTMWLKRHHTKAFFVAALQKYDEHKQTKLLRDAASHSIKILKPSAFRSDVTWKPVKTGIRAGFTQIPGIGEKTANAIIEHRRDVRVTHEDVKLEWPDLIAVKGIGPVTIAKLREFVNKEDPFNVYKLRRMLKKIRRALRNGDIGDLPYPTHKASEIPYEAGEDIPVTWVGVVTKRNLRDLFEFHLSKKGTELDPETVKRPDLREWVIMLAEDEEEVTYITFSRFDYQQFKRAIWSVKLNEDVILVEGIKRGFLNKRDILVKRMWVIGV